MRKKLCIIGTIGATAVAAVASLLYARTGWAWLLAFTGCAVMLMLIFAVMLIRAHGIPDESAVQKSYRKKSAYISPAEREFLYVLRSLVGARYEVCVQAPLVAVVDKVSGGAFRNELFRVVDYLIADAQTCEPLLLVELNDASHNRADRKERDRKVAEICASARIPLVAFTLEQARDAVFVRKTIHKLLK